MKVKAVIMRPDRTNDVVKLSKRKIKDKTFRYGNYVYFLDQDRFMVSWERPNWALGLMRKYFATYYYRMGVPKPLPVPGFQKVLNDEGDFIGIANDGVSSEELASLFNPWFYRTIAPSAKSAWDYLLFYGVIGGALAAAYLVYMLSTGNYEPPKP